jgi:hypothetical protein
MHISIPSRNCRSRQVRLALCSCVRSASREHRRQSRRRCTPSLVCVLSRTTAAQIMSQCTTSACSLHVRQVAIVCREPRTNVTPPSLSRPAKGSLSRAQGRDTALRCSLDICYRAGQGTSANSARGILKMAEPSCSGRHACVPVAPA